MAGLIVKAEYNQAAREFPQISRRLPALTAQALNATATEARKDAVRAAAVMLSLSPTILDRRFTRGGKGKGKRTTVTKRASAWDLEANIQVYRRGIPFFQLPVRRWQREGINRGYGPPFKVRSGQYAGVFFVRKAPRSQGSGKGQLEVPRISVRKALDDSFRDYIEGPQGRATFRRKYAERINLALARAGVRA
jgi:hypothetical protein